jgi:glutamyl-tRNA synthetase
MPPVRTRFEPSPSGSLHVGNALGALFNWLWARKHDGTFVLRIADTDKARVTEEGLRSALEDLRWLGLAWDEGPEAGGPHAPYFQSERFDLYRAAAHRLLASGHAYRCYCTPEELEQRRREALAAGRTPGYDRRCRTLSAEQVAANEAEGRRSAVRLLVPEGETRIDDLVHGEVVWPHEHIDDSVLLRADGSPLYMLAAAYDDMSMGITHVIRGDDIFPSTPKQILLMRAWGAEIPRYAHFPLLVGPGGEKLSKRHGPTSIAEYRRAGYLPEALLNYLAVLDWSVGDGVTERFTIPELIAAFDPKGITRNPSAFDVQKLTAFNAESIRALEPAGFVARIEPFMREAGIEVAADHFDVLIRMAPLVQERIKRLDEAPSLLRFLFEEPEPDEKAAKLLDEKRAPYLEAALDILERVEPWSVEAINEALMSWADGAGVKRKDAFQPLRAAITGSVVSPPLFESIEIIGRERAAARVRTALKRARGA